MTYYLDLAYSPTSLDERQQRLVKGMGHLGAFVVQFRNLFLPDAEEFEGRIEHVGTGEVAHFNSPDELLNCIARMLGEARRISSAN